MICQLGLVLPTSLSDRRLGRVGKRSCVLSRGRRQRTRLPARESDAGQDTNGELPMHPLDVIVVVHTCQLTRHRDVDRDAGVARTELAGCAASTSVRHDPASRAPAESHREELLVIRACTPELDPQ